MSGHEQFQARVERCISKHGNNLCLRHAIHGLAVHFQQAVAGLQCSFFYRGACEGHNHRNKNETEVSVSDKYDTFGQDVLDVDGCVPTRSIVSGSYAESQTTRALG